MTKKRINQQFSKYSFHKIQRDGGNQKPFKIIFVQISGDEIADKIEDI